MSGGGASGRIGETLPVTAAQLQRAFDPAEMRTWTASERQRLQRTLDDLRRRFDALADGRP